MRPGPDMTKMLSLSQSVRVDVVRGRDTLALDVPVENVQLSCTSERRVPVQVTFDAPADFVPTHPLDILDNYGQRIHLQSLIAPDGGVPFKLEIGWFQIEEWAEDDKTGKVSVTALDLLRRVQTNEFTFPTSPPRGATLRSELQRLAGDLPVILDDVADVAIPTTFQWGVDRLEAIADLCAARGLEYGVRPDGYLHVWERRAGRDVAATYTSRDLLQSAPRVSLPRAANRFITTGKIDGGEDAEGKKKDDVDVSAVSDFRQPPFDAPYGIVVDREEISSTTTRGEVAARNRARAQARFLRSSRRTVHILFDPRVEPGDVISIVQIPATVLTGRVIATSATLDDQSALMEIILEELTW